MNFILIVLQLIITFVCAENARFDNYRVYSLNVKTQDHLNYLHQLENIGDGYDFWSTAKIGSEVDIMIPPHKRSDFEEIAQNIQIEYKIKIKNVQSLIDNDQSSNGPKAFGWTKYNNLEEIYTWLDDILSIYPTILSNFTIGKSYEGRPIRGVKLSHKAGNPTIFIESNIHAREWITSATATWFLNELLTSNDTAVKDLAENIDWYIIPVLNVDGFVYTHKRNRLWRKTRQPHSFLCYGTDANRNFDFQWMVDGASTNPCSDIYAGPKPFSEPETLALSEFISKIASDIKIYLAFHSYGQYILCPYAYTYDLSENHENLMSIGNKTGQAFAKRYKTKYEVGTASNVLYIASGISVDYVYGVHNVSVGYTFEFRDRKGGIYGQLLPPKQIIPNSLETLDGILAMVEEARRLMEI